MFHLYKLAAFEILQKYYMPKIFYKLLILIVLTTITGCGFTPHNTKSLPPKLKQVYFQAENKYGQFEVNLKRKLKSCGVTLLSSPEKDAPIIYITSNYSYVNYNPTSSTQARVYILNYTATISISDFYNHPLLDNQNITVSRSISLQPNEVFAITPQIETVKQQMVQELVIKTLNILSSPQTFKAMTKLNP